MNIQRILCPIDFSGFNDVANEFASMLAESNRAVIVYLHVSRPVVTGEDRESEGDGESNDGESAPVDRLRELRAIKPARAAIEACYVTKQGDPAGEIIRFANSGDIDLIVMGTHGRSGLPRILLGSVAEAVIRDAECPVLAIKPGTPLPVVDSKRSGNAIATYD
jgi:nucleotide-binding universal stress UspA family protein